MGKVYLDFTEIGTFNPQKVGTSGNILVNATIVGTFTLAISGLVYANATVVGTYRAALDYIERIDLYRKATDGIGRFRIKVDNTGNKYEGVFSPDDPIAITIEEILFMRGYFDKGHPISEDREGIYRQSFELAGRDYGQDLQNKSVNKTGEWLYKKQYADDIIDDMLSNAGSEIIFTPDAEHQYQGQTIPQIQYMDRGEEFLCEAFRKICEKINYDFYVDEFKVLHLIPIDPSIDSGIILKCVADAADNNIIGMIRKTEFDSYELRNYIIAKAGGINDGWSDGNAEDFTGSGNNVISNEYIIKRYGTASIRSARGTEVQCEIILSFPKHDYDYLPFDLFYESEMTVSLYVNIPGDSYDWPYVYIELEDTQGLKIRYYYSLHTVGFWRDYWDEYPTPIGTEVAIRNYDGYVLKEWQYSANPGALEFNWRIVEIKLHAHTDAYEEVANLYLDGMVIPLPMVSYRQDATSQTNHKVRMWPILAKYIRTQRELDELAENELEKRKDPIEGLVITAQGTAGVIGGVNKWIPSYKLRVNSPGDGFDNAWYRIMEVHIVKVEEPPVHGNDFFAEVTLVPHLTPVSGMRRSYSDTPEIALYRAMNDKVRFIEMEEEYELDWWPPLPAPLG